MCGYRVDKTNNSSLKERRQLGSWDYKRTFSAENVIIFVSWILIVVQLQEDCYTEVLDTMEWFKFLFCSFLCAVCRPGCSTREARGDATRNDQQTVYCTTIYGPLAFLTSTSYPPRTNHRQEPSQAHYKTTWQCCQYSFGCLSSRHLTNFSPGDTSPFFAAQVELGY